MLRDVLWIGEKEFKFKNSFFKWNNLAFYFLIYSILWMLDLAYQWFRNVQIIFFTNIFHIYWKYNSYLSILINFRYLGLAFRLFWEWTFHSIWTVLESQNNNYYILCFFLNIFSCASTVSYLCFNSIISNIFSLWWKSEYSSL